MDDDRTWARVYLNRGLKQRRGRTESAMRAMHCVVIGITPDPATSIPDLSFAFGRCMEPWDGRF